MTTHDGTYSLLFRKLTRSTRSPPRDLGVYHVPFSRLVGTSHIEGTLLDACRRFERVAVIGDSGTGKTSLTASVLGPLAQGSLPSRSRWWSNRRQR